MVRLVLGFRWRTVYLGKTFVQPIDGFQRFRISKRQGVWSQPHDIAMFGVQLLMGDLRPSLVDIEKPPQVGERCKQRARILVQSPVESIADCISTDEGEENRWPVV